MENIKIRRHTSIKTLCRQTWNSLAGASPFRQYEWFDAWCNSVGQHVELLILTVEDTDRQIIGIAPFYVDNTLAKGNMVHFVGGGKACSDYLGLLASDENLQAVATAVANWFLKSPNDFRWTTMSLEGVTPSDFGMSRFAAQLGEKLIVDRTPHENSWIISLPDNWEAYLSSVSKRCRRMLRQLDQQYIQTGRATFSLARDRSEVQRGLNNLIALHTARRQELGCDGCFSDNSFVRLIEQSAYSFLDTGSLKLGTVEIDGVPAAVALSFSRGDSIYAYQCGYDPQFSEMKPGWLLNQFQLRYAIENGYRRFDFLRGNEAYKSRLGAEPVQLERLRITNRSPLATWHRIVWNTKNGLKPYVANMSSNFSV